MAVTLSRGTEVQNAVLEAPDRRQAGFRRGLPRNKSTAVLCGPTVKEYPKQGVTHVFAPTARVLAAGQMASSRTATAFVPIRDSAASHSLSINGKVAPFVNPG